MPHPMNSLYVSVLLILVFKTFNIYSDQNTCIFNSSHPSNLSLYTTSLGKPSIPPQNTVSEPIEDILEVSNT